MNAQLRQPTEVTALQPPLDPQRNALMHARALGLPAKFCEWLELNWAIWFEFVKLADQMRLRGRKYYSARAVIHVLRLHRALKDPTEPVYKINNNRSAEMARLYNAIIDMPFFRTRAAMMNNWGRIESSLQRSSESSYPYVVCITGDLLDGKQAVTLDGRFNADDLRRIIEELERV